MKKGGDKAAQELNTGAVGRLTGGDRSPCENRAKKRQRACCCGLLAGPKLAHSTRNEFCTRPSYLLLSDGLLNAREPRTHNDLYEEQRIFQCVTPTPVESKLDWKQGDKQEVMHGKLRGHDRIGQSLWNNACLPSGFHEACLLLRWWCQMLECMLISQSVAVASNTILAHS